MKYIFTFLVGLLVTAGAANQMQAQSPTNVVPPLPSLIIPSQAAPRSAATTQSARVATATTIRYVKAGASGSGTSWSNASGDLQAMINASASGDQVWMAGGTYKPSTTGLSDSRSAAFSLRNGVSVLGGFTGTSGTEGNAASRTAMPSSTTLSGDIGNARDNSDNSYHVINNDQNELNSSAVIDGVTISSGNANDNSGRNTSFGGGMLNNQSSPTVNNCLFTQNFAIYGGGLTTSSTSAVKVTNCYFLDNTSFGTGAFYDGANTNSVITNCYFEHNTSTDGAYTANTTTSTLVNCTFRDNTRAITLLTPTVNVVNCLLWNNGGANAIQGSGSTISYSALEAGATGFTDGGNNQRLNSSPFENARGPGLRACAVAVDAGNNTANSTATDVLGNNRKVRTIDIGAAEFQGAVSIAPSLATNSQSATSVCAGTRVEFDFTVNSNSQSVLSASLYRDNTNLGDAGVSLSPNQTGHYGRAFALDQSGSYQIVVITTCSSLTTIFAPITVNPLPTAYSVTGGGAYCQGSNGIGIGLSNSQTEVNYQLLRGTTPVGSPVAGTGNSLSFGNQTIVGTYTVLATNASTGCQQAMNGSTSVSVTPLPSAPSLLTQSGYAYPAGQSSLTISQNVGPVSLTAIGCSGGMIMASGNAASSLTIITAMTGTQTYTATCTQNGCTGPAGSFQLTVLPTTLSVLHRDADYGDLTNNSIKPYLELANAGGGAIPYSDITVRYWFTSEGNAPPTNLAVYYAQLGAVNMRYVALAQPRQGAYGYVEYSFPGGGSLAGGANSGPIENGIQKTDGSSFDERDDYSYQANYQNYVPNSHITAYRNGTIFYGQEPTTVASQTAVQVYSQAQDGPTTSQIQTRLELRNTGNVALTVGDLKLRYYFTSDNGQPANVYMDYADMGASNVQASVVKLTSPVNGADSYVELSFPGNSMHLNALSSLGAIDFRLVRSDYGLFDQSNDYSYAANYGNEGVNNNITAYLGNMRIFGTPPAGAARVMAVEPTSVLQARLLGNPVVGSSAEVEITGVSGQAVHLKLVDLQGRSVHEQRLEQAGEIDRVSLPLGTNRGQLLLKVSTDTQQQSLKLIRP